MSISTRKGDGGETDLLFGRRVPKTHPRVVACGTVDELNAALGLARAPLGQSDTLAEFIAALQADLVALMGELATLPEDKSKYIEKGFDPFSGGDRIGKLDAKVAEIEAAGLTFRGWAMPGAAGDAAAAALDFARTVCRRAEREVVPLGEEASPDAGAYLNRLSDALWLCARLREAQ